MQKLLWTFVMTCIFAGMGGVTAEADSKIAFTSTRDNSTQIWVMDSDGSNPTQLTSQALGNDGSYNVHPAWSGDGTQIAFHSNRDQSEGDTRYEIYTMSVDGSNQQRITFSPGEDSHAAWCSLEPKIVFHSIRSGSSQVWVMDSDGSNPTQLTSTGANNQPTWSPDCTQIAFSSKRTSDWDIYVMDADGSNQTNLTVTGASHYDSHPAWCPDGPKIAFNSTRDGDEEIWVMDADGSNPTQLTTDGSFDASPAWSPGCTQITFDSSRDGDWDVYVMDADGSNLTNLTHPNDPFGRTDSASAWFPDLSAPEPVPAISPLGQTALVLLMSGLATAALFFRRHR